MNTKHLAYFVEVANCRSISKAAKNLYLSQPSLSASIAALEEELGVALFHRSQTGVTLTEQGAQILEIAVEILNGVNKMEQVAKQDHQLTGRIQISAIPAACGNFLVELIRQAQKRYPKLSIVVQEERPRYVIQQVLRGEISLGITSFLQEQAENYKNLFQETRLTFETLYEDRLCLFVPEEHPLAARSSVSIQEVKQYPLTSFHNDVYLHQLAQLKDEQCDPISALPILYQFNNLESIKQIVYHNLACAVLPRRMVQQDGMLGAHLVSVDLEEKEFAFCVGFIYRSGVLLPNAEQRLIELLREIGRQNVI